MSSNAERVWVTGEAFPHSTTQVNNAGDRLRRAAAKREPLQVDDMALLDFFRSSHYPASREVLGQLQGLFHEKLESDPQRVPITGRPLKTHGAIIAKLVREKSRLATAQDIAGARVIVPTPVIQEAVLHLILAAFPDWKPRVAKDTREAADKHGYRALHIVVTTQPPA